MLVHLLVSWLANWSARWGSKPGKPPRDSVERVHNMITGGRKAPINGCVGTVAFGNQTRNTSWTGNRVARWPVRYKMYPPRTSSIGP